MEIKQLIKSVRTKKQGGGAGYGNIIFETPYKINVNQATEVQIQLGYHPNGYGFYKFRSSDFGTRWECSQSCD